MDHMNAFVLRAASGPRVWAVGEDLGRSRPGIGIFGVAGLCCCFVVVAIIVAVVLIQRRRRPGPPPPGQFPPSQ